MRARRSFIHQGRASSSMSYSFVEKVKTLYSIVNLLFFKALNTYCTILFFSNLQLFQIFASNSINVSNGSWIEQIMKFFIIQFKKRTLNCKFSNCLLFLSPLKLIKDKLEYSRNNTNFRFRYSYWTSCSHRVCFATTCLSVGKNGGIKAYKTAKNQIASTNFKELLLLRLLIKNFVKLELFFSY